MNEEQKQQMVNWLLSTLKDGQGFVLEQAPDIAQQIVMWGRTFKSGAAIVLVVLLIYAARKAEHFRRMDLGDDAIFVRFVVSAASALYGLVIWASPRSRHGLSRRSIYLTSLRTSSDGAEDDPVAEAGTGPGVCPRRLREM
jgi:hypothetical protein